MTSRERRPAVSYDHRYMPLPVETFAPAIDAVA